MDLWDREVKGRAGYPKDPSVRKGGLCGCSFALPHQTLSSAEQLPSPMGVAGISGQFWDHSDSSGEWEQCHCQVRTVGALSRGLLQSSKLHCASGPEQQRVNHPWGTRLSASALPGRSERSLEQVFLHLAPLWRSKGSAGPRASPSRMTPTALGNLFSSFYR